MEIELKIESLPEFKKQFIEKTKNLTPEEVAVLVWKLTNEQWSAGFDRGYYDPDYGNDELK